MAAMRGPRVQVGSAAWIADERTFAFQVARTEAEEFSFSARNELDWLNEHMAGVFDENETNLADTFKTPGKLRAKTPCTQRKDNALASRIVSRCRNFLGRRAPNKQKPLSNVFGTKVDGSSNAIPQLLRFPTSTLQASATENLMSPIKLFTERKDMSPSKTRASVTAAQDSGYFGSQDAASLENDTRKGFDYVKESSDPSSHCMQGKTPIIIRSSRAAADKSPKTTSQTSREEQLAASEEDFVTRTPIDTFKEHPVDTWLRPSASHSGDVDRVCDLGQKSNDHTTQGEQPSDNARSPSDNSSPIRPVVRKSSLNFASLPAREPLTAGKSIGTRVSRISHLDHTRISHYNIQAGSKSLGQVTKADHEDFGEIAEMELDQDSDIPSTGEQNSDTFQHAQVYTQRLQKHISMLANVQSTSSSQPITDRSVQTFPPPQSIDSHSVSSNTKQMVPANLDACPNEGDDNDWIEPPATEARFLLPKSHTTDIMEHIQKPEEIDHIDSRAFQYPEGKVTKKQEHDRATAFLSTSTTSQMTDLDSQSAACTYPILSTESDMERPGTPLKLLSRSGRDSPLKHVKNKLSSILKSSRSLLASSAAVSAEGKSSLTSPSAIRMGIYKSNSSELVVSKPGAASEPERAEGSPSRPIARRTRASAEREKEEKRREKEVKLLEAQNEKLTKARKQERENALIYSREQERIAAMEKQLSTKKEEFVKDTPKQIRTSPRKFNMNEKEQKLASDDVETHNDIFDAPSVGPQSLRSNQPGRSKETRRPKKPTNETRAKAQKAPTVIRVNTSSQHSQYHLSGRLSATSHDLSGTSSLKPQTHVASQSSKTPFYAKLSTQNTQNLRAPSSASRPKVLNLTIKKKELEDRESQRRRELKSDMERNRTPVEEQRKQELLSRQETVRLKPHDHDHIASQLDVKTPAQWSTAVGRKKQTRAPPPALRSQQKMPPGTAVFLQERYLSTASNARGDAQTSRTHSRVTSNLHNAQDESTRSVNVILSQPFKAGVKRPIGADRTDENDNKRAPSRGGLAYQANDAKRRRTSDTLDDKNATDHLQNINGVPVRPSGDLKDMSHKTAYGYASTSHSVSRDLFKATVTTQHNSQSKPAHPLDMAQISKGDILFAQPANAGELSHRTAARPEAYNGAKSATKSGARSSPRFQNGESIELPEIDTDDEDEDEDDAPGIHVAAWADSPDLRKALMRQETMDPSQIFGPPALLNMEEVFSKSKDRWNKFRARTSSANWSGADRLTEEDIRKDLAARDKLRREGGWSYEMSREMM